MSADLMKSNSVRILTAVVMAVTVPVLAAVQVESLQPSGEGSGMGTVGAISADGSALTGSTWSWDDYLPEAFRWTAASGLVEIQPGSTPSSSNNAYASSGWGISDSQQTIVGWKMEDDGEAFTWINGTLVALTGNRGRTALGVSRDGTLAVGQNPTDNRATNVQAVTWQTASGTVTPLPDLAGGLAEAAAVAISADKSVIAGWGSGPSGREACRWVGGSVLALGDLPGGRVFSEATALSGDGQVIVGRSLSTNGMEAFRWTETNGMEGLGDLPGGCFHSEATGVSDDGGTIVGVSHCDSGQEVFVWNASHGMRSLKTLMQVAGVDVSGWQFSDTQPVLAGNGDVMAGDAIDPDQNQVLFRISRLQEMTNCVLSTVIACCPEESDLVLRFQTEPGLTYQAEGSAALTGSPWIPIGSPLIGTGGIQEIRCAKPEHTDCQFYRLAISN